MKSPIAVVVLAAGAGTRMKSALPKVLHPLAGWPMVRHVLANAARLKPARIVGQPARGWRTFGRADFMRVPAPAASTTTAMGDFMTVGCHGAGAPARCANED